MRDSQPYGQYIFSYMASMLVQEEDLEGLTRLLDDEIARARSEPQSGRQAARNPFIQQQQEDFLSPPGFPPKRLQQFPASVLAILHSGQGMLNPYTGMQTTPEWNKQEVINLLPRVNDPTLRLLLAHMVGAEEVVSQGIEELMAGETPTLDAYLLTAAWAAERERPEEAVELLDKARYLPHGPRHKA